MDNSYESLKIYPASTTIIHAESKECFICREGDEMGCDALLHFCDCKNLIAHQKCVLTWIQKSSDNQDRARCKVCTAEYQLQKGSVWRILFCHWQNWLFFCLVLAVMTIIPLAVYRMMVAFKDPPPSAVFHAAAVCFGVLAETLLIKYVLYYCSSKYNEAKMSSFSVRARTVEQCDRGVGLLWPAGQNPSTAVMSRAEMGKQEAVKAKEGFGLKLCV
ncbi:uncharacterized protein LOC117881893 [Trachemys scripta elegans]|uniref:uncharacterized protein LOC112109893 n=2 Tax=Emydidae TaxID=8476 RepID=UPI000388F53C|nr:uncharacterized protein LOC101947507 isoform X2 [Chrysemys picta bellii]XP_024060390.1 uncharacterized protein LOC112109893 [Terrapene carolina triunguis]XP_029768230.1 uncharacterized protein LOC115271262 [Terrapene carolina triunguis]XP_034635582.1 uncharacterized protein LOC117881893 [Trachemys scripta elegans]XP_053894266.1 uncharacterized protein LOC128842354 [Malaclemys terrapin pileata]